MNIYTKMRSSDFDFHLPENLIGQRPPESRGNSRMLVLHSRTGECEIRRFRDIGDYLRKDDCVVLNNSRVIKARLFGIKKGTGARIEILLIRSADKEQKVWQCLVRPGKRISICSVIELLDNEGKLHPDAVLVCDGKTEDGIFSLRFMCSGRTEDLINEFGHSPLPPYIKRKDEYSDMERYQTVYAKVPGSVAAPTAGLHFSSPILSDLAEKGIRMAEVTLHVGPGTFLPVNSEIISDHKMHSEFFSFSAENAGIINETRRIGRKILAVGTTVVRVLETCSEGNSFVFPGHGETSIFLYPPYCPKVPDMLLTNFHLPKSTLLMLVCCFAEKEKVLAAYETAKSADFKFYSYGDCMLVLRDN